MGNKLNRKLRAADIAILVAVLGSLWGLSEVVLNEGIRSAGLPWRAGILTGVGMLILGMGLGLLRKPSLLLMIPVIAILMKQLAVPVLHVSTLCKANSCLATMLQGAVLAGGVGLLGRRLSGGKLVLGSVGAIAALGSAVPFYFIGLRLAPCPYLLSFNRPEGFAAFMMAEGLVWAAFSALSLPLGYHLGVKAAEPVASLEARKPLAYYAASVCLVICCWTAAAITISSVGVS